MDTQNIFEGFTNDDKLRKKLKDASGKKHFPPDIMKSSPFDGLSLDEEKREKIHKNMKNMLVLDIGKAIATKQQQKANTVNQASRKYSKEKVTSQMLWGVADWLCGIFNFIYIENGALYIYLDDHFQLFSYAFASRFLTQVFREHDVNYPLRSTDFKEIVRLLQAQPQITRRQDHCQTNQDCILFEDGAFDVPARIMRKPCIKDYQFSKICYPLKWGREFSASPEARDFIRRFCDYSEERERYLWELIGYLLSSYRRKIIVVFLGPSNSGKSTLANMIRRICGTEACVALGIKDLSGSFSMAELQGKRLCIDSEMDASALNAKDISMLKKVVGDDLIQGNRKYEQQFYFQCQTKFLLCTNNKIRFRSEEDTVSFLNRMKIFELQESIPQEEQIYNMNLILDENRTYFLQQAMKGLVRLVSNNFEFSYKEEPENFVENVNKPADLSSIDEFVNCCCQYGEDCKETVTDLYDAYIQFARDNGMKEISRIGFSRHLVNVYGVIRKRSKKNRFLQGIKLVTDDG